MLARADTGAVFRRCWRYFSFFGRLSCLRHSRAETSLAKLATGLGGGGDGVALCPVEVRRVATAWLSSIGFVLAH